MKTIIFSIFLVIFIIIIFNYFLTVKENFDTFSPYAGNQSYPFVYQQKLDQQMLRKSLKPWETPFNCHNEGYYNAEPKGIPPMVTICSYENMKKSPF
jgi:hypothetical protein